ncbi:MAG: multinuclear nonheme iron-dependent oxidase [Anaerolineae bacterium]
MTAITLAANYSAPLVRAIETGQVRPNYLKCHDDAELVHRSLSVWPTYVHFSLEVGADKGGAVDPETHDLVDWGRVESLLAITPTPHVSLHLIVWQADLDADPAIGAGDDAAILAEHATRDVKAVVARLGPEHVVVEHSPPIGGRMARAAFDPAVISRVVEESGCGFLLDLAHARLSAIHTGVDSQAYVERLPLHRLREMHVSGVVYVGRRGTRLAAAAGLPERVVRHVANRYVDHAPLSARDWQLLQWALAKIRAEEWPTPWCLASEYGGVGPRYEAVTIPDLVVRQVQRLAALVVDGAADEASETQRK